jgi:hypothetical protein
MHGRHCLNFKASHFLHTEPFAMVDHVIIYSSDSSPPFSIHLDQLPKANHIIPPKSRVCVFISLFVEASDEDSSILLWLHQRNCLSITPSPACKGLRLPAVQAGNLISSTAPCPVAGLLLMLIRAKCNPHGTRNLNYLRSVTVGNKMSLSTQEKGLVFKIYHQTPHQRLPISPQP